jgi:ammonium transporter, Amt family
MKKWLLALSLLGVSAFAEDAAAPVLNSGDTAWMMMSTALVMLMTPIGLALFYGGMTRSKNILIRMRWYSVRLLSFIAWVVAGFSIAFGTMEGSMNQVIGGFGHIMLSGISWTEFASVDSVNSILNLYL